MNRQVVSCSSELAKLLVELAVEQWLKAVRRELVLFVFFYRLGPGESLVSRSSILITFNLY